MKTPFIEIPIGQEKEGKFPGIEEAIRLRKYERSADPIIFTSFRPLSHFKTKKNGRILSAIGHSFLQKPYSNEELERFASTLLPLNPIQLKDIICHCCDMKGAVSSGFHDLKNQLKKIKNGVLSESEQCAKFLEILREYETTLKLETDNNLNIMKEYRTIISKFDSKNIESIDKVTAVNEDILTVYLPSDEGNSNEDGVFELKPWKILFLDDEPTELKEIFEELDKRKIAFVKVKTYQRAVEIIEEDCYNTITVIVCDFRLYETNSQSWEGRKMQQKQGYDFLVWASKLDKYHALVALSGMGKGFLMESFRQEQLNVKIYPKNGLQTGGVLLFVEDLEQMGKQNYEILENQPKAKFWKEDQYDSEEKKILKKKEKAIVPDSKTKTVVIHSEDSPKTLKAWALKRFYSYHRNHKDYYANELEINRVAEAFAREMEYAFDTRTNFNFASMTSIQGDATKNLKGKIEEGYPDFIARLTQRRIFYYMMLKGFERDAICKIIHKGDSNAEMSESMIRQIPLFLAIQTQSDIPYNLLVEEKYFLQHHMSLPIHHMAQMMDQTHILFNDIIDKFLQSNENLKDELNCYLVKGKGVFRSISFLEADIVLNKINHRLCMLNKYQDALELNQKLLDIMNKIKDSLPMNEEQRTSKIKKLEESIFKIQEKENILNLHILNNGN
jgi:hypothetical protein